MTGAEVMEDIKAMRTRSSVFGEEFPLDSDDFAIIDTSSDVDESEQMEGSDAAEDGHGLVFSPPILQYFDSAACIPSLADFTITNNFDRAVSVQAITSDNPQYYPVLFQPQTLQTNSSISIQVRKERRGETM